MIYRKPTFDDVEAIYQMVYDYAQEGAMLARSRNTLYETLRDMVVAEEDSRIIGVGGLHFIWDKLAEVRTMAVASGYTRRGVGAEIVRRLLDEGRQHGVTCAFTLTYQVEFFAAMGFRKVAKEELPPKVWKDCIDCPKFPNCDEVAMVLDI